MISNSEFEKLWFLYISAALRWELGHRLIVEAERDMQVRPAFELVFMQQ